MATHVTGHGAHGPDAFPARLHGRIAARRMPRRCTILIIGLVCAGLAIPLLMAARLLPITLLLGFLTLALLAAGGGLLLARCGEI